MEIASSSFSRRTPRNDNFLDKPMLEADLYLDKIDLCRYWPSDAPVPCREFLTLVKAGKARVEDFSFLSPQQRKAFELVLETEKYFPKIPMLTVPQPVEAGLIPINQPGERSPVIVTCNNRLTLEVLMSLWAQSLTPAYFLVVDCKGSTVDMAVIFNDFSPERLKQALDKSRLEEKVEHRKMIIPGLAGKLSKDFALATGWEIETGPVCAAELPLFLGDRWVFPD